MIGQSMLSIQALKTNIVPTVTKTVFATSPLTFRPVPAFLNSDNTVYNIMSISNIEPQLSGYQTSQLSPTNYSNLVLSPNGSLFMFACLFFVISFLVLLYIAFFVLCCIYTEGKWKFFLYKRLVLIYIG